MFAVISIELCPKSSETVFKATLQFENNIRIETVSKLLGHASIEITSNTYTHVMKKEKQKAVDTLALLN